MLTDRDIDICDKKLHPYPQKCRWTDGAPFRLTDGAPIDIVCPAAVADGVDCAEIARKYWYCEPQIKYIADDGRGNIATVDGFMLNCTASGIRLAATSSGGLRNALRTLRQLAEQECGGIHAVYVVPPCEIEDYPSLAFRAVHLCIFPESNFRELETMIRIAAYCKCNYVILENWGGIPLISHPEICWDQKCGRNSEDLLAPLLHAAAEEGITLIPGFNLLGHASLSKINGLKHSALSRHPELQELYEPTGWSWCLSNPATRDLLSDVVEELHERFGNPPFFHIGCDEAYDVASCHNCRRQSQEKLLGDHLTFFSNLLQKRGARGIMWHDMLLERADVRWQGYNANGRSDQKLGDLYRILPRELIIADWEYEYDTKASSHAPEWPEVDFFQQNGFDTLLCTLREPEITQSLGDKAVQCGALGFMMTTWEMPRGHNAHLIFLPGAAAAWGTRQRAEALNFAVWLRHTNWDMKLEKYEDFGTSQWQINPHPVCEYF